jgi:hypothetical protein
MPLAIWIYSPAKYLTKTQGGEIMKKWGRQKRALLQEPVGRILLLTGSAPIVELPRRILRGWKPEPVTAPK